MTPDAPPFLAALATALAVADADLRDRHHPAGAERWYAPSGAADHLYPSCPGLRRSLHPGERPVRGRGVVYPDAGDVCGWCVRVWRARGGEG